MGINYSLCLLAKREDSDSLLENLCTILDSRSRDRIGSKKWLAGLESSHTTQIGTSEIQALGIAGLELEKGEFPNSYCLSLQIQLEPELEPLLSDHGFECFEQPGSFGCMWTSVFASSKYFLLEMTAATSDMSRALQQSKAIHRAWIELAKKTNALFAYIDIEDQIAMQLFPVYGDLRLPDYDLPEYKCGFFFSVDRMVSFLIETTSR